MEIQSSSQQPHTELSSVIQANEGSPTTTAASGSVSPRKMRSSTKATTRKESAVKKVKNPEARSQGTDKVEIPGTVDEAKGVEKARKKKSGSGIRSANKTEVAQTERETDENMLIQRTDNADLSPRGANEPITPRELAPGECTQAGGHSQSATALGDEISRNGGKGNSKTRSPSKQISTENVQVKAKIASLISKTFAATAYEIFAGTTQDSVESCFPSVSATEGLRIGSSIVPGTESLPRFVKDVDTSLFEDKEEISLEELRDVSFAGAFIGSSEIIEECLKKGADLSMADPSGRNIFHVLTATGHASLLRKVLRRLEKTHGQAANTSLSKGDGSQRSARRMKRSDVATFADIINAPDRHGWTPLLVAVCRNNVEAAEALLVHPQVDFNSWLQHNCPPSQHSDDCQSCAIHFAAIQGNSNLVKRLMICGVPIDVQDSMGRNIFHYAAVLKDGVSSVNFLKSLQEEPQFTKALLLHEDAHGRSPLFVSISWGNLPFLEAALNIIMINASTPTHKKPEEKMGGLDHDVSDDDKSVSPSLTRVILSQDKSSLSAVHIAYLRRHYDVLFRLSQIWDQFRVPECDAPTLVDAVGDVATLEDLKCNVPAPSVMRILNSVFSDHGSFSKALEADLSAMELSTYKLLRTAMQSDRPLHDSQVIRAVRVAGTELCLRSLTEALNADKEHGLVINNRRLTVEGNFFHFLKLHMEEEMSQGSYQSNWRFIHVDKKYSRRTPEGACPVLPSIVSQAESFSLPMGGGGSVASHVGLRPTSRAPYHASVSASRPTRPISQVGPSRAGPGVRSASLTEPRFAQPTVSAKGHFREIPPSPRANRQHHPTEISRSGMILASATRRGDSVRELMSPSTMRQIGNSGPHDRFLHSPGEPIRTGTGGGMMARGGTRGGAPIPSRALPSSTTSATTTLPRFAAPTYSALANSRVLPPQPSSQSPLVNRSASTRAATHSTAPRVAAIPTGILESTAARSLGPISKNAPVSVQHVSSIEDEEALTEEDVRKVDMLGHERFSSLQNESFEDDEATVAF